MKNAPPNAFVAASVIVVDHHGRELLSVPLDGATDPGGR
jgi:hypothetical protein